MLIDELRELALRAELDGCVVGTWVRKQDDDFKEVFELLRGKPNLNISQTLAAIKSHHPDLPFKRTAFTLHLKGECACPKA